jgi:hypothetical protein
MSRATPRRRSLTLPVLAAAVGLLAAACDLSLAFGGTGTDRADRVEIPVDPPTPIDVGATDFTIEWWMRGIAERNSTGTVTCGNGVYGWITGHTIVDRDRYPLSGADGRDFGVSVASNGRLAFGVENADGLRRTVCATIPGGVLNGQWHHVAVQRALNGRMEIWIDGVLRASAMGPPGDISYPDGFPTARETDPYLVIGAEKHDVGPAYPSFAGQIDELRISNVLRYTTNGSPPSAPFTPDAHTVGLYHFNEGTNPAPNSWSVAVDSATVPGAPTDGMVRANAAGTWPKYSGDSPFATVP